MLSNIFCYLILPHYLVKLENINKMDNAFNAIQVKDFTKLKEKKRPVILKMI